MQRRAWGFYPVGIILALVGLLGGALPGSAQETVPATTTMPPTEMQSESGTVMPSTMPAPLDHVLNNAVNGGDPAVLAIAAGANPLYAAQLVYLAASRRPDLAGAFAAKTAARVPKRAVEIAVAASRADHAQAPTIVYRVGLAVRGSAEPAMLAILPLLSVEEQATIGASLRLAAGSARPPTLDEAGAPAPTVPILPPQ